MNLRRFFAAAAVACACVCGPALLAAAPAGVALSADTPEILSAVSETGLTLHVSLEEPGSGVLTVSFIPETGGEPVLVASRAVALPAGASSLEVGLDPSAFIRVPLYEDVSLNVALSLTDGRSGEAWLDATLVPEPARALASGWLAGFASKPALLYTTRTASLQMRLFNPKTSVKSGTVKLVLMDDARRHKVRLDPVSVVLPPGFTDIHLTVPASATSAGQSRGDTQIKAVLKVAGIVKATDFAAIDYDLDAQASADVSGGRVPLDVAFAGSASGGRPPYTYAWTFGDGATASGASADHTFTSTGSYPAVLTVTDAMGGAVTSTVPIAADDPLLTVQCQATPSVGPAPLEVTFSATAEGGTGAYSYSWAFGDGAVSTQFSPTHTYASAGTYHAQVTVTSGTQNVSCTADVTVQSPTHTIAASATAGGAVSPSGPVTVVDGADQTFAFVPDAGYHVADVTVDGTSVGAPASYTFHAVHADHTLVAAFARNTFTITATAGPGGSVTPSGAVSVTQGSSAVFVMTPDPGYHVDDVLVDGVSVGAVSSYTFPSVQANHTLSASFERNTHAITATAGTGGTITPSGTVTVVEGASQSFAIAPSAGYHLTGVSVDGAPVGVVFSYTFTDVQADHTIAASFAVDSPGTHIIYATATAGGSISPSGAVVVSDGADQSFAIAAQAGHHLADVLVDGVSVGPVAAYTFTSVGASHTIEARFEADQPNTFLITATATVGGSITPSGVVTVPAGGSQAFDIAASPGYYIADVVVDGVSIGVSLHHTFTNVQSNHTIHAVFAQTAFTIRASAGSGGSISPSGDVTVPLGQNRTFTITPDQGYEVAGVLVDGGPVGPVTTYTFTDVQANHTIAASFQPVTGTLTITAGAGAGGSIAPSGAVTVTRGADQAFAITPDTGYHVDDVLVDGSSVGAVASYTFTNVQANHTITALFAINTYTISASAGSGGTIAPSGAVSVLYGADKAFTIAPDTGFVIADVLVDGSSVGPVTNYTFTNVQADHTIEASFATAPNHPPVISDLLATPDVIPAGTGSSTVTFTLTDPDGDPIMWSAVLGGSTSTGDLGSLNTASGTVSSGTGVTLTYSANKAGTGTVTVTIQAHDGKGGNATPQTVTLTLF